MSSYKQLASVSGRSLLSVLGKSYLYFRFRNQEKVQQELIRKYEGRFENAGTVLLADIFMALAVVTAVTLVAGIIYLFAA
ncbi:hypothetical protein ACFSRY_07230 [Pontibacter locisalis]|uniref:Uncharacterized protein n=1 Tax=Pontibacter locisalis TaxID=1719035 RepID=A0ABW5IKB1_9BACT